MAIQTEVWVQDIASNLFPNNNAIARSRNEDIYVNNKTVHRAQAGTLPNVQRNRNTLPATIVQRTDTIIDYDIYEFTSDPTLIRDIEEVEVSCNKRQDVLKDHIETLRTKSANFIFSRWCPSVAANIIGTTGSARTAAAAAATGTRKALTRADILKAKILFDTAEIPQDNRCILLDAFMYNDLLNDTTITSKDWSDANSLEKGFVNMLMGFEIYLRSSVGRMATGNTGAKDPDAVNAVTDNAFGLVWHPDFVGRAKGEVKAFADLDKPEFYGSIFSSLVRTGGDRIYTNYRGVAALVETV